MVWPGEAHQDTVRIWPPAGVLGWPGSFTAVTVEETVAEVALQVGTRGGDIYSVLFTSKERP